MGEFIEELKHNQNINFEKGLENRVNIDYIIERLEDIQHFLLENTKYFKNIDNNKNLNRQQLVKLLNIIDNIESKGVFKD